MEKLFITIAKAQDSGSSLNMDTSSLGNFVLSIQNWVVGVAIAASIMMLAWAGIIYMTSQGSPDAAKSAKDIVIGVLSGLAIILLANFFLKEIVGIKW